jgi:predicted dehydrogenase
MAWTPPRAPRGWRGRKDAGGGRFYDLGAHLLDQELTLLPGRVTSVYCRMHHDYADVDVESHAMCVLGFADGATGVVDVGGMHKLPKPRIQAFGREGAFVKHGKDPQEAAMKAGDIDAAVEPPEQYGRFSDGQAERVVPTIRGDWKQFYRNVADVLSGRAQPAITLAENRRLMAVYDAAWRSAASGAVVMTDIEPA